VYDDKAISPDMLQASIKLDVSSWWTAWGHRARAGGPKQCSCAARDNQRNESNIIRQQTAHELQLLN
jgi:hypothetical protein